MATENAASNTSGAAPVDKGKGKAPAEPQDTSMDIDEDSNESDDEVDEEADETEPVVDEPDEESMEEIDQSNILGRRTRGKKIDYAKAAAELPEEDDDEDDDDDFEAPDEVMKD